MGIFGDSDGHDWGHRDAELQRAREEGRREAIADAAVETTRMLLETSAKARREGYDECTADVVGWLREQARVETRARRFALSRGATRIEANEHVGAAGRGKL